MSLDLSLEVVLAMLDESVLYTRRGMVVIPGGIWENGEEWRWEGQQDRKAAPGRCLNR